MRIRSCGWVGCGLVRQLYIKLVKHCLAYQADWEHPNFHYAIMKVTKRAALTSIRHVNEVVIT